MGDVRTELRALAHPGAVLALVVLVVNDHVLKQAWPGWVTGKASDVAGLVVAPLILAALLALVQVPRPTGSALVATGVGFVFCKTTTFGAAVTSSVWSLLGTPTMIRADITDLVALPALWGAWRVHRAAARDTGAGWRRTASLAVGAALLPLGVLATSATSCGEWNGYTEVAVVEGDFPDLPHEVETRLGAYDDGDWLTIDALGRFAEPALEVSRDQGRSGQRDETCVAGRCWRIVDGDTVESSSDGGLTWTPEGALTEDDREVIEEEQGEEQCGDPLPVRATDIAAVELDGVVQVIVSLQRGGIWRRNVDGTWTILTIHRLGELVRRDHPSPPVVTERDQPPPSLPSQEPADDGTTPPSPDCADPTTVTVTPNPLNGPPTAREVCP